MKPSLLAILAVSITAFVMWEVTDFSSFVLDDPVHLQRNERMGNVNWENIKFFWTNPYENAYMPVSYTAWLLVSPFAKQTNPQSDLRFRAIVFHRTNFALHLVCCCLVFWVLYTLFRNQLGAFVGALFFGLHPVQVEPIAWITGMRGLIVGCLSMISLLFYFSYVKRQDTAKRCFRSGRYIAAFLFFLLATLAKPSAYALLFMIALIGIFYLRRSWKSVAWELLPWLAISALFIPVHMSLNGEVVARAVPNYSLWVRPLVALDSLAFYLGKLFVPVNLTIDYGRTPSWVIKNEQIFVTPWVPILLALGIFLFRKSKAVQELGIILLLFSVALLPVLGLTPFIFQHISTVSDRYLYLAMIAPALLLASLISRKYHSNNLVMGTVFSLLLTLGWLSRDQMKVWRTPFILFRHNVAITPHSWLANNNLAHAYEGRRDLKNALIYYKRAGQLANFPAIMNNIGAIALKVGLYEDAISAFNKILTITPDSAEAYNNLGVTWVKLGQDETAQRYFNRAIELDPSLKDAGRNLKQLKSPHKNHKANS